MVGYNVYWTKNGSDLEKVTFIMADSYEEAYDKVLRVKGGSSKIIIIRIQEYDRLSKSLMGEPVYYKQTME